jgi:hypothetical protein
MRNLQLFEITAAANILKKQSQTATMGVPPAWGLSEGLTMPYRKNLASYKKNVTQDLGIGGLL